MNGRPTLALVLGVVATPALASTVVAETVYVETSLDTDGDGQPDRIYVSVDRPSGTNLPAIMTMSPYAMGGNNAPTHNVNLRRLPQDPDAASSDAAGGDKSREFLRDDLVALRDAALERGYASLTAHSIGTGRSSGCPTVGDEAETLAAKAVIDWLGGRARGYTSLTGTTPVAATWASGAVGMTGVSYNGTLPNMVATTGVEGLKAIVPVAAISSWYDYYRAGGLVVGPGGYVGEDADVLGKFIVRAGACSAAITRLTQTMGREHGDFDGFWQARDYVAQAAGVRAAVFIMHGQSDWNVRQRHAIRWWEALQGRVPVKMWLHKGGHSHPSRSDTQTAIWAWFDRYVKGVKNGADDDAPVEVESPSGAWTTQQSWPSEMTSRQTLHLNAGFELGSTPANTTTKTFVDAGRTTRLESLLANPTRDDAGRLAFVTPPLAAATLLSGTPSVTLDVAVLNRRAANLTVAIVEYPASGSARVVTRGWADPQNHADMAQGEPLVMGQRYALTFDLEPKQYTFARGSRIGVVVTGTDYDHTIRPEAGTELSVTLGRDSFVALDLSGG
jgi:X-Pro dipeptidyl-peptidase